MPLEPAVYIKDFNSSNPAHTDGLNVADSHMRLIKAVLQAQFPAFTSAPLASTNVAIDSAVTAVGLGSLGTTPTAALIPIGGTIMWWSNTLPNNDGAHWAWCNGLTIGTTAAFPTLAANCPVLVSGGNVIAPNLCEVVPMGRGGMGGSAGRGLVSSSTPSYLNYTILGPLTVLGEAAHTQAGGEVGVHAHTASGSATSTVNEGGGHRHPIAIYDPGHTHTVNVASGVGGAGFVFSAQQGSSLTTSAQSYGGIGRLAAWDGTTFDVSYYATTGLTVATSVGVTVNASTAPSAMNITQPTMPVNWIIRIA
jgi:hypothetical protein